MIGTDRPQPFWHSEMHTLRPIALRENPLFTTREIDLEQRIVRPEVRDPTCVRSEFAPLRDGEVELWGCYRDQPAWAKPEFAKSLVATLLSTADPFRGAE